jgi:hypothetical protein
MKVELVGFEDREYPVEIVRFGDMIFRTDVFRYAELAEIQNEKGYRAFIRLNAKNSNWSTLDRLTEEEAVLKFNELYEILDRVYHGELIKFGPLIFKLSDIELVDQRYENVLLIRLAGYSIEVETKYGTIDDLFALIKSKRQEGLG